ncbi:hypothetical protein NI18_10225 [Sphingomonas sp. Ant20]|nr:hypothetical protein NI18_10225 [Sphingomonas sp. Ant20]
MPCSRSSATVTARSSRGARLRHRPIYREHDRGSDYSTEGGEFAHVDGRQPVRIAGRVGDARSTVAIDVVDLDDADVGFAQVVGAFDLWLRMAHHGLFSGRVWMATRSASRLHASRMMTIARMAIAGRVDPNTTKASARPLKMAAIAWTVRRPLMPRHRA